MREREREIFKTKAMSTYIVFVIIVMLSVQCSIAKTLRHAQSSVGETNGDCRSIREMADPSAKEETIRGYTAFIDGDIKGSNNILPLGGGKPFVYFDPEDWGDMPPPIPLGIGTMYPKVIQGWKAHYQPPHNQIEKAMKVAVEKLLELKANFKVVGGVESDDTLADRDKNVWKTFTNPPINADNKNNLFGKMITIYGHRDYTFEADPEHLSTIVTELNTALRDAGIDGRSNVPPSDCRIEGLLSGFSMRFGIHRDGYHEIDNQMYKMTQKGDGAFVCWCRDDDGGEERECDCPTHTRRRHYEGEETHHIYEDDIRRADEAIDKRRCTCRPDWVNFNAGDLVPKCPKKDDMLQKYVATDSIMI